MAKDSVLVKHCSGVKIKGNRKFECRSKYFPAKDHQLQSLTGLVVATVFYYETEKKQDKRSYCHVRSWIGAPLSPPISEGQTRKKSHNFAPFRAFF